MNNEDDDYASIHWPDGSRTVDFGGETTHYSAEEVREIERDIQELLNRH